MKGILVVVLLSENGRCESRCSCELVTQLMEESCICSGTVRSCDSAVSRRDTSNRARRFALMSYAADDLETLLRNFTRNTFSLTLQTMSGFSLQNLTGCVRDLDDQLQRRACRPSFSDEERQENIEEDFQSMKTVLGVLSLIRNEWDEEELDAIRAIRCIENRMRSSLMCKQYKVITSFGTTHLSRRITPSVEHWCRTNTNASRYERDFILLEMMADYFRVLKEKYRDLERRC